MGDEETGKRGPRNLGEGGVLERVGPKPQRVDSVNGFTLKFDSRGKMVRITFHRLIW